MAVNYGRTFVKFDKRYYKGELKLVKDSDIKILMSKEGNVLCENFDRLITRIEDGRELYENDICLMVLDRVIKEVIIKIDDELGRIIAVDGYGKNDDYVLSSKDLNDAINGICGTMLNGKRCVDEKLRKVLIEKMNEQFLKGKKPVMPSSLKRLLDQFKFESGKTIEIFEGPYTNEMDALTDYQIIRDIALGYKKVTHSLSIGVNSDIEDDRRVYYIKGNIKFIEIN